MSKRTSIDGGEIDGYFGQLDMDAVIANPASFKKLETPEGMRTTLHVSRVNHRFGVTAFSWRCAECGSSEETPTFKRPLHTCDPEIKAGFNAILEAGNLVNA